MTERNDRAERSGSGFKVLAANVGSLLTTNVINRATSFIVYALVAGFLGAVELGQLALAVSLFQLFSRFALFGLETLTTREIAKDRNQTGRYLGTASATTVVTSLLALPAVWIFVELMSYSSDTSRVILFLFLGLIPYTAGQLTEATFLGWERSKYVAYANSPIWIAQTGIVVFLLRADQGVEAVALSMAAAYAAIVAVHWLMLARMGIARQARVDLPFAPTMLKSAAPFLGIQGMNAIRGNVSVLLLSRFAGEAAVGIFSAAKQLLVPFELVFQATGLGVFPAMVRQFTSGVARLRSLSARLVEFTLALAIPVVTGLFVLAGPILLFVYRDRDFLDSVVVLRILVWTNLALALTAILGQILWASRREMISVRIAVLNTVVKVIVAFVLIWRFDVVGAAVASVIVGALNLAQHYIPVAKLFGTFDILRLIWKPAVAAAMMAMVVLVLGDVALGLRIAAGAVTYAATLFALYLVSAGGYGELVSEFRSAGITGSET